MKEQLSMHRTLSSWITRHRWQDGKAVSFSTYGLSLADSGTSHVLYAWKRAVLLKGNPESSPNMCLLFSRLTVWDREGPRQLETAFGNKPCTFRHKFHVNRDHAMCSPQGPAECRSATHCVGCAFSKEWNSNIFLVHCLIIGMHGVHHMSIGMHHVHVMCSNICVNTSFRGLASKHSLACSYPRVHSP